MRKVFACCVLMLLFVSFSQSYAVDIDNEVSIEIVQDSFHIEADADIVQPLVVDNVFRADLVILDVQMITESVPIQNINESYLYFLEYNTVPYNSFNYFVQLE